MRGIPATLAESHAFLEAALASRPDIDLARTIAENCELAGADDAARALRSVVDAGDRSNPELVEAVASALNTVEGLRSALKAAPAPGNPIATIGGLAVMQTGSERGPGIAAMVQRLSGLAVNARTDPAGFIDRARSTISTSPRPDRVEIAWALPFADGPAAADLVLSTPGLGRGGADALVRMTGVDFALTDRIERARRASSLLETEVDSILTAVSALVRLGRTDAAAAISDAVDPHLCDVGNVLRDGPGGTAHDAPARSVVSGGLACFLRASEDGDFGSLIAWMQTARAVDALRLGRLIAGWDLSTDAADIAWGVREGVRSPISWSALIAGVEAPGTAARLLDRARPEDMDIAGLLTTIESRIAIAIAADDPPPELPATALRSLAESGTISVSPTARDAGLAYFGAGARVATHPKVAQSRRSEEGDLHALAEAAADGDAAAVDEIAAIRVPAARRYEELLLASAFPAVARQAAAAIAARGRPGAQYAATLLDTGDATLAEGAFMILAQMSLEDARDELIEALGANDPWLLRSGAWAAGSAAAATADRDISRALINAMSRVAGGPYTVVPALGAIGNKRAIEQIDRLNERGQLFEGGRDDALLEELLRSGEEQRVAATARAERERVALHDVWRAEGRLDDFGSGRLSRIVERVRGQRAARESGKAKGSGRKE